MRCVVLALSLVFAAGAQAQFDPLSRPSPQGLAGGNPLTQPTLSPGVLQLMQLDAQFSREVEKGGGAVFATWFAENAVTLNNGKAPVYGKTRIAADANWDPKLYQLKWQPTNGEMGPSGDMGYTWGHFEGHAKDAHGNDIVTKGRYITVWKRMPDGKWKVALDASANEPPEAGDCCALPKP